MSTADLQCTLLTSITPKRLSKRFTRVGNTLVKESGGNLTDGIAEFLTFDSLAEFAALLPTLKPNQALAYGVNGHNRARVIPKDTNPPAGNNLPVINRTRDHFRWPEGAGLLMLDYDPAPDGNPLGADELHAALATACPALADAPAIWRPSASSCIHNAQTDEELRGIGGQRLYVPVLNARDIPRAGQALFERLWLAGFGRYELSKSGAFLARTLIDASVFQPERLDFCGGAECGKGLAQRLPDPVLINPTAPYLDTALILDLTPDERATLDALMARERAALDEEQVRVREAWIAERVSEQVEKLPEPERAQARPSLERVYRQAAEGGRLDLDFEITVVKKGGKTRKPITVRELLAHRAKYHEATTLDPLEPDYPNGEGRLVGWLNLRAHLPYLQSWAHGGVRYGLGAEETPDPTPIDDGYWESVIEDAQTQQKQPPDRVLVIQCVPGALPEMVDQAESALCKYEDNFYQRGGQLVRWCISHAETVRGITRPGGAVIILNQDADYLLDRLNRLIGWERWSADQEDYVPCNAPRNIATTLLARRGHWQAQPLIAAVNAPTLRPDGSILDQPGYDAATGLLFVNPAVEFPPIPPQPTCEQATEALAFLYQEVLSGFPFAAPHDRSAALSAILTACVRHSLKTAPMHTFNAPVMASGKSLLADVVALISTGHPATVMSHTPDGDEMRKRVLSVLMQGDLVVNLDNIEEPLANQTLCSVLTQESFSDRILGVNKTGTAPTLCCWLATGNNLTVAGDMTTRIVPCNLDPQVERPEEREFPRNLYDWIPANRPALVRAVLTMLRGYVVAGRPKQPIKNFARFEDWSGLVRSALVWLGEADPLGGREQLEDGDPVRVKLRALLQAWFAVFRTAPATSKEAVMRSNETELDDEGREQPAYPALREVLEEHFADRKGAITSNGIGYFLRQHAGRILMGARFEAYGGNAARVAWRVVVLDANLFERERGKISNPPPYPNHPKHPNLNQHPNPPKTAGNPHSCVTDPPTGGWDGCHSWDVSPRPENFADGKTASPAARILARLHGVPAGVADEELKRAVCTGKGTSPALVDMALTRLVKEGVIAKVNGRWVEARG